MGKKGISKSKTLKNKRHAKRHARRMAKPENPLYVEQCVYGEDGETRIYTRSVADVYNDHHVSGFMRIPYLDVPNGYYLFDIEQFEPRPQWGDLFHQHQRLIHSEFRLLVGDYWQTYAISFNDGPVMPIHGYGSFMWKLGAEPSTEQENKIADLRAFFEHADQNKAKQQEVAQ